MSHRVTGYLVGALAGLLSVPAALIAGTIGILVPLAAVGVFLRWRTVTVEVLLIGAMGGVGLGLIGVGVIDYFANWAGTQSCSGGPLLLAPGQTGSSECGGVPPAPWLICGAAGVLVALTVFLVRERRRQRGTHRHRDP